jgi:hypothetical protein
MCGQMLVISIRRKERVVGRVVYGEACGFSAGDPTSNMFPVVTLGRTDRLEIDIMNAHFSRCSVVLDVKPALRVRLLYHDTTCMAVLIRLQLDVLMFACLQSNGPQAKHRCADKALESR